jgi:hypothetical protein
MRQRFSFDVILDEAIRFLDNSRLIPYNGFKGGNSSNPLRPGRYCLTGCNNYYTILSKTGIPVECIAKHH